MGPIPACVLQLLPPGSGVSRQQKASEMNLLEASAVACWGFALLLSPCVIYECDLCIHPCRTSFVSTLSHSREYVWIVTEISLASHVSTILCICFSQMSFAALKAKFFILQNLRLSIRRNLTSVGAAWNVTVYIFMCI